MSERRYMKGIENCWDYARPKLKSYYGVLLREHFYFYLKEMDVHFNYRKVANLNTFLKNTVH